MKLELLKDPNDALISYAKSDKRLIFATSKTFGVAVNINITEMNRLMDLGVKFAEVEDATCAIGFQSLKYFFNDENYVDAMYEADQMRDVMKGRTADEAAIIWDKRRGMGL